MDEIASRGSRLTFGGLATGLDTGAIIEALLDAERRPLNLLESRKANLESQQSALQTLSSNVLALRDAARKIDNRTSLFSGASFDEEFLAYRAQSGDEDSLEVEVTGNVAPGSFEIQIDQLAAAGRKISSAFADPNAALTGPGQGVVIATNGDPIVVFPAPDGSSLSDLRDLINSNENNGGRIQASLLDDGTGTRLVLSGTETGATNEFRFFTTLAGPGGAPFIEKETPAQDAKLHYLGVSVTRDTNDIADLVPGVSLRLRGETEPGTPVEVNVSRDDESIEASVQALVDAYNSVQTFMNDQAAINPETNRGGVLIGDSLTRRVESRIRGTLIERYDFGSGNPFQSISQIGLEFQKDGTLAFDAQKLRAALDQDPASVRELLSGVGEGEDRKEGVATALAMALDDIAKPGNAFFAARDQAVESRLDTLENQIARLELRLLDREEFLVRQFSQLESLISTIRAQSGFLGGE